MDQVCEDHSPIIITRSKAQSVVMISLEDYEALQETGYWSRRINEEDHMVYNVTDDTLLIVQLRYHY